MRIGKYVFDEIDTMKREKLDALKEAVRIRNIQLTKQEIFLEEVKNLIQRGKENGYQLVFTTDNIQANLSCDNNLNALKVEDKEEWSDPFFFLCKNQIHLTTRPERKLVISN